MTLLSRLVLAVSTFANRHGLYLGRRSAKFHVALYRWADGRIGGRISGFPDARILLFDHVGARSGIHRTNPAIFLQEGGTIAIAASKAGQPDLPGWFHNLRANPDTTIQIGAELKQVRARVATDEERNRLWPGFVALYPAFETYQRAVGDRRIPVVLFEPR